MPHQLALIFAADDGYVADVREGAVLKEAR